MRQRSLTTADLRAEFVARVFHTGLAGVRPPHAALVGAVRDAFHEEPDPARVLARVGDYEPPDSRLGVLRYRNGTVATVHRLGFFDAITHGAALVDLANATIPEGLYRRRTLNDIAGTCVRGGGRVYDTSTKFGLSFYVRVDGAIVAYTLSNQHVVSEDGRAFLAAEAVYVSLLCVDAGFQRTTHGFGLILSALTACAADAQGLGAYITATSADERNSGVRRFHASNGLQRTGEPYGDPPMIRYTGASRALMERRLANLAGKFDVASMRALGRMVAAVHPGADTLKDAPASLYDAAALIHGY